jgi:hypothetical protein
MGFLLLSEQNTLKRLLNFHMSYFTNSLITNISIVLPGLSDAVVPDLVVRRSIAVDLYGQKLTYTKVDLVLCSDKAR